MPTVLVDVVLISVSGATGLLVGPALLVFGNDRDVPVFLSKTCCSKKFHNRLDLQIKRCVNILMLIRNYCNTIVLTNSK